MKKLMFFLLILGLGYANDGTAQCTPPSDKDVKIYLGYNGGKDVTNSTVWAAVGSTIHFYGDIVGSSISGSTYQWERVNYDPRVLSTMSKQLYYTVGWTPHNVTTLLFKVTRCGQSVVKSVNIYSGYSQQGNF